MKVMTKAKLGERALQMLAAEVSILRTLKHREFSLDVTIDSLRYMTAVVVSKGLTRSEREKD